MTGNKGKKNNNSIQHVQLTCVQIAIHIFAKFPLYHSEVLFVIGHFMLVLGVCQCSFQCFSVVLGVSCLFLVFRHTRCGEPGHK